jgi:hypothetical protein
VFGSMAPAKPATVEHSMPQAAAMTSAPSPCTVTAAVAPVPVPVPVPDQTTLLPLPVAHKDVRQELSTALEPELGPASEAEQGLNQDTPSTPLKAANEEEAGKAGMRGISE